jgi:hypothetical protein
MTELWVDYALGGGSSGARTTEAGGSTESEGWSTTDAVAPAGDGTAVARVAGAQGTP